MYKKDDEPILFTTWESERAYAETELREIEKERALEDVVRLIKRFDLQVVELANYMGNAWLKPAHQKIKTFEPYFGSR